MDILIVIDNISQNYKWCNNYNTIKRWIVYWMNDNLIKGNLKSFSVGKTHLEPSLVKLEKKNLKIENIIILLDSIVIKKSDTYYTVNIKNIFDMILLNKFNTPLEKKKSFSKNKKNIVENTTLPNTNIVPEIENDIMNEIENDIINNKIIIKKNIIVEENNKKDITDCKRIIKKNIVIEEDKNINNYTGIYVFTSIYELKLSEENKKYITESLLDKIVNINFINFSNKQILSIDPKITEKCIVSQNVDNYKLYVEMSQLLNLKPQNNDFNSKNINNNDFNISDMLQKLYEIEFENYKKSNWSEDPISKNIADIYLDYMETLNKNKQSNFGNMDGSYVNFLKHSINWVRMSFMEKNHNINLNIPSPKFNDELMSECAVEIIKFYNIVYLKILPYRMGKKNPIFKKFNQLDFSNVQIKKFSNDDSTNYLYSSTTMSNWKQEYENLNPFGIFIKYDLSNLSHKGIYEHDIMRTYPNIMISSISNNFISLFDYYQLISADIDTSTKIKFCVNDYVFIDNLHGNSNVMLPVYINSEHWKVAKLYWTYHMSFINGTFEFDYVKKMDNIYFLVLIKLINIVCNIKRNQNISRLLFYILRTNIQICIDNKYSYNNKSDYDKYYNSLLLSCNLETFKRIFIDYLIRLIQVILTNSIKSSEINENMNTLFVVYMRHMIKIDHNNDYFENINKLPLDERVKEIEHLNEKFNLNVLCFGELKKDMVFLSNYMEKIYSIKKFNQLIKFLDKYNGCLPISEEELNCNVVDSVISELLVNNQSIITNGKDIITKTELIVL